MKILGLGRIKKTTSRFLGQFNKIKFENHIQCPDFEKELQLILNNKIQINLELVTFTNSKNFLDFLLSILSFVSSNGLPVKWTIYADDEFTLFQKKLLSQFSFLVFKNWFDNVSIDNKLLFGSSWQYRKYLSFSTHSFSSTTIFLDSDVLFYNHFKKYIEIIKEGNWYLPDPAEAFSVDEEIFEESNYKRNMYVINSGFIVLNHMPAWNLGLDYLKKTSKKGILTHFTEQSAINIVYTNDPNAKILEPRRFHISLVDNFRIRVLKTDHLAIRHYVGPIRHKMWQASWKKFIKILY